MHCSEGEFVVISSSLERFSVDLDDCIGVESCMDLRSDLSFLEKDQINISADCRRKINNNKCKLGLEKKTRMQVMEEYPPPITWLGRTENFPSCRRNHMPYFIMKKYQFDDGRLIIREEKVNRHEYFQAHRSNGRLTLHLVPLTGDHFSYPSDDDDDVAQVTTIDENQNQFQKVEEESMPTPLLSSSSSTSSPDDDQPCMDTCGGGGVSVGVGGEYYNCVGTNSTVLGTALPAIRPVHT